MPIYLVRHAHAVTEKENPTRPLSERGRDEVRRLAAFFRENGNFRPSQVWHSPLARSRETAERLHAGLMMDVPLVEVPGLLGEDEPHEIATRLASLDSSVSIALVGHEPHLSALATLLLRGKTHPVVVELKKGAVFALKRTDHVHKKTGEIRWLGLWLVVPELIRD